MNKVTNQIRKELQLIATKLPTIMNGTKEYHWMTGRELNELGIYVDDKGVKLIPDVKYLWHFPVQIASNHFRKLRKEYEKNGQPGVIDYIRKVKAMQTAA